MSSKQPFYPCAANTEDRIHSGENIQTVDDPPPHLCDCFCLFACVCTCTYVRADVGALAYVFICSGTHKRGPVLLPVCGSTQTQSFPLGISSLFSECEKSPFDAYFRPICFLSAAQIILMIVLALTVVRNQPSRPAVCVNKVVVRW
jgi:hypothetical protein